MILKTKTSRRLNFTLRDKRVKLLYTNDPKAKLPTTSSATGTIDYTFENYGKTCTRVSWSNSDSVLMLIEGADKYEIFD
jgi:hypothetical protein